MISIILFLAIALALFIALEIRGHDVTDDLSEIMGLKARENDGKRWETEAIADEFTRSVVAAAIEQTTRTVIYDPAYFRIDYPDGDVPSDRGVCTDVIIRAYRSAGIDLQKEVHEDMLKNFGLYPDNWGLTKTDTNIDHRRVPNLQVFFKRFGEELEPSEDPGSYRPGDIVTWNMPSGRPHIGLVSNLSTGGMPLIVHNIGAGPKLENMLFDFEITGHYRYMCKG